MTHDLKHSFNSESSLICKMEAENALNLQQGSCMI